MPGIFGMVTKLPPEVAMRERDSMMNAVRHQGSYECGTWDDWGLGIYCGWTARAGSFPRGLPLRSPRGHHTLLFAGEELPLPPKRAGEVRDGAADEGGYLAEQCESDAVFPGGLNGRFQGLAVDHLRGTANLFNDRFGLQRLYYHEAKDTLYFAAEAKSILAVRPELRRLHTRSLGEWITCGCVLENRSLFEGIGVLPPASRWILRNGSVEKREQYFDPRAWEAQPPLDAEEFYQRLREVFCRRLPHYFGGRQQVGMSLTGGLDTRMILACWKPAPGSLPCYSFGSMFRDSEDVKVARRIASICGQTHQVIPVAGEFLSRFGDYAERVVYLTDGCADVSHAADLYVNERAARIAPVRMTGNYGGELLRRVRAFKAAMPQSGSFVSELQDQFATAGSTYEELTRCHPLSFAVFRQAPYHHYGMLAVEQTQLSLRSPFLDNEFVRTLYQAPEAATRGSDVSCRLIADGNAALAEIPTDRGLELRGVTGPGRLRRAALNFTFKAEYAYDYGMPGWLARIDHTLGSLQPERLFLGRHKFNHYRFWYKTSLSGFVRDLLLDPRSLARPHVERRRLEALVHGHLRGGRNHTTELHKFLTLELLSRTLLDLR